MLEEGRVPGHILVAGSGDYRKRTTHEELESWPKDRVKTPVEGDVSLVAKEPTEIVFMELDCNDQSTLKI